MQWRASNAEKLGWLKSRTRYSVYIKGHKARHSRGFLSVIPKSALCSVLPLFLYPITHPLILTLHPVSTLTWSMYALHKGVIKEDTEHVKGYTLLARGVRIFLEYLAFLLDSSLEERVPLSVPLLFLDLSWALQQWGLLLPSSRPSSFPFITSALLPLPFLYSHKEKWAGVGRIRTRWIECKFFSVSQICQYRFCRKSPKFTAFRFKYFTNFVCSILYVLL